MKELHAVKAGQRTSVPSVNEQTDAAGAAGAALRGDLSFIAEHADRQIQRLQAEVRRAGRALAKAMGCARPKQMGDLAAVADLLTSILGRAELLRAEVLSQAQHSGVVDLEALVIEGDAAKVQRFRAVATHG